LLGALVAVGVIAIGWYRRDANDQKGDERGAQIQE
jgi:hypothetical protein